MKKIIGIASVSSIVFVGVNLLSFKKSIRNLGELFEFDEDDFYLGVE